MPEHSAESFSPPEVDGSSFGSICAALSWANLMVYDLENRKWSGRQRGQASDREINEWDLSSRSWCERRSVYKGQIDQLLKNRLAANGAVASAPVAPLAIPFQVLPISLMIDMLTIENIKIFDLASKGNSKGVELAAARRAALKVEIDQAFEYVLRTGRYDLKGEARTFAPR